MSRIETLPTALDSYADSPRWYWVPVQMIDWVDKRLRDNLLHLYQLVGNDPRKGMYALIARVV